MQTTQPITSHNYIDDDDTFTKEPSETMIFSSEIQNENESFTEHLSFFHHNSLFSIFEPTLTTTPFNDILLL